MKRAVTVVEEVELEPFTPPSVEVIVVRRKTKDTWHIVTLRAQQARRDRSTVAAENEQRLTSEKSGVKAAQRLREIADARSAMAVEPPGEGNSMYCAICPTHGLIRGNSTIDYALESAYWHALKEHDH